MKKKKPAPHREGLVQANCWIKPETKKIIEAQAREDGRSYAKQLAYVLNEVAASFTMEPA